MKLKLQNQVIDLEIMNTFFKRLRGNMGKKNICNCLCFPKCNSIHTFFMKSAIDIIMTDKNNIILYIYNNFTPNKVILPKRNVYYTYELPSNSNNYQVGDKLKFIP